MTLPSLLQSSRALLLVLVVVAGCSDDSSGANGDSTTTTAAATTSDGGTSADTSGQQSHEVCDDYIACVGAVTPEALPAAQEGFGEGSVCWEGSPEQGQMCIDSCKSLLQGFHDMFPDEPKCYECQLDTECNVDAGESCYAGNCSNTACGNGAVESEEVCDSQPMCGSDCLGPADCSPFTNADCEEGDGCKFRFDSLKMAYRARCSSLADVILLEPGADCTGKNPEQESCSAGNCLEAESLVGCQTEACCTAYCDVTKPESCPDGSVCKNYMQVQPDNTYLDEGLDYVGLCVKP